jgi:hypothetical protein
MSVYTAKDYIEWGLDTAKEFNTDRNQLTSVLHNRGMELARLAVELEVRLTEMNREAGEPDG